MRKEPLDEAFRKVLLEYAQYLDKVCVSFSLRFAEPKIETEFEAEQVIKAICSFMSPLFFVIEEILRRFGGYLQAGAPDDVISKISGKAYKIKYSDET